MTTTYSQTRTGNGLAIASLVCGLVGIFLFNIILGPLAIIFGAVSWGRANRGAQNKGMAVAGVILGIVDVALFALFLALVKTHGGYWHVG
jgi:hypothetical protein